MPEEDVAMNKEERCLFSLFAKNHGEIFFYIISIDNMAFLVFVNFIYFRKGSCTISQVSKINTCLKNAAF